MTGFSYQPIIAANDTDDLVRQVNENMQRLESYLQAQQVLPLESKATAPFDGFMALSTGSVAGQPPWFGPAGQGLYVYWKDLVGRIAMSIHDPQAVYVNTNGIWTSPKTTVPAELTDPMTIYAITGTAAFTVNIHTSPTPALGAKIGIFNLSFREATINYGAGRSYQIRSNEVVVFLYTFLGWFVS
jgi:hypothetical protein